MRLLLQFDGFDGGGYDEFSGDFSGAAVADLGGDFGGMSDPTTGDLGTIPDPQTTVDVTTPGADPTDFGGSDAAFDVPGSDANPGTTTPVAGPPAQPTSESTGSVTDHNTSVIGNTVSGIFSGLGGLLDSVLGSQEQKKPVVAGGTASTTKPATGVGGTGHTSPTMGSPSSPANAHATTIGSTFSLISADNTLGMLIAVGVAAYLLWKR